MPSLPWAPVACPHRELALAPFAPLLASGRSSSALVALVADSPSVTVFAVLGTLLVILIAVFQYIHRLNLRHARLLADLEHELAVRRRIEEALRKSEGFYHSLVESLPQSILRKDLEGRFTFANQRFCAALERTLDQIVGTTDFDYFPKELAEKYRNDDKTVMETGQILDTVERHVTPHGEALYVHVIKTPLHDALGRLIGVQGIFWDVTASKRAEEQLKTQNELLQEMARSEREAHAALKQTQSRLVEQEKLAGLGQIAAGVAHEINNPVSFVTNNVAVLKRDVGEMYELLTMYREAHETIARERPELAARIAELCERVDMDYTLKNVEGLIERSRDGLKRIQQIVAHLRTFVHLDEGEVNEADLNAGVESTAAIILGHARRKHITLTMDLQTLPPVTCSAAKINQVVMNLLTNAIDACNEGGAVKVRTRPEDGGVRIEVNDDGCGMPAAVRERIFEPFYTTKPVGAGTGLGLSISYGIVADHGGSFEVESEPGKGTTFVVHLPLRRAKPRRDAEAPGEENGPAGRAPEPAART